MTHPNRPTRPATEGSPRLMLLFAVPSARNIELRKPDGWLQSCHADLFVSTLAQGIRGGPNPYLTV